VSDFVVTGVGYTKFKTAGVGFIVEVDPETGERLELVSITTP
jgi:hypothetical protein